MCDWNATVEEAQVGAVKVKVTGHSISLEQSIVPDSVVKCLTLGRAPLALRIDIDRKEGAKEIAEAFDVLIKRMQTYLSQDTLNSEAY